MKRYKRRVFVFDTIFVFIMIALVTLYGHLIAFYTAHTLFIVFIFIIIMTASIYVHDVIRQALHQKIKGLRVVIQGSKKKVCFPNTITVNEIRKKNHQLVYRYQGYNIPVCFVEHVDQEKAHLYPFCEVDDDTGHVYEVIENYRYEFFLVKDIHQKKYIVNRTQVLSIE
ncbi:MAG: hypothetical protein KKH92_08690 [Firmicutes bacterium]|nr:hypothetical protein [Bacillota bacterium]